MKVERDGLGYRMDIVEEGVAIRVDRLNESRGEMNGEVTVERAPEGHIMRSRVNLTSSSARSTAAKFCATRSPGADWVDIFERFCIGVLDRERDGAPARLIGDLPLRPGPEWLLEPILIKGTATMLYGEGGVGKSTMTAAIALSVACGRSIMDGWAVKEKTPVLVIDWESDAEDWNDLFQLLRAGMGYEPPAVHYMEGKGSLPGMMNNIAREITRTGAGLIIVDSVGLATPASREGSDANDSALRLFAALRTLGVTSLLIDHVSKSQISSDSSASGPYGSVYKTNSARSVYELRAGEQTEDGARTVVMHHRKANRTKRQEPLAIRITRDLQHIHLERSDLPVMPAVGREMDSASDRVWKALEGGDVLSADEISEMSGITPSYVRKVLTRELKGRVENVGEPGLSGRYRRL